MSYDPEYQKAYFQRNKARIYKRQEKKRHEQQEIFTEYGRLLRLAFPDRFNSAAAKYRKLHPERVTKSKKDCNKKHNYYPEYAKKYRSENPEIYRESSKRQRQRDPVKTRERDRLKMARRRQNRPDYRILENLRGHTRRATLNITKCASTVQLLGCSIKDFRIYLESKFEPGMNWQNYGKGGWEIDHIIPCALFDLNRPDHQRRCFHFSNLQPMWGLANRQKGHRCNEVII